MHLSIYHYFFPKESLPPAEVISHNRKVFSHLIRSERELNQGEKMHRTARLVSLAATLVLQDPDRYIDGKKKITEHQITQIKHKLEKFKIAQVKKEQYEEKLKKSRLNRFNQFIKRLQERYTNYQNTIKPANIEDHSQIEFYKALQEDFYQSLGCIVAYLDLSKGDKIATPFPDKFYEVEKVIKNNKGLQVVVLTPPASAAESPAISDLPKSINFTSPIFCCRGTLQKNPQNILDDLYKQIGYKSSSHSQKEIQETLEAVGGKFGPSVLLGHSLGGAVAQHITAEHCDKTISNIDDRPLIHSLYHYNAPGIGASVADLFDKKLELLPDHRKPYVVSYHHQSDYVAVMGWAHLSPNKRIELVGHTKTLMQAHSWSRLISEWEVKKVLSNQINLITKISKFIFEVIRIAVSKLLEYLLILKYVTPHENSIKINAFIQSPKRELVYENSSILFFV